MYFSEPKHKSHFGNQMMHHSSFIELTLTLNLFYLIFDGMTV